MPSGRRAAIAPITRHHGDTPRTLRALLERQRQLELGRLNNTCEISLTNDGVATSTTITVPGVRSTSVVLLDPYTADSMADYGLGTTWAERTKDTITIHHPASATVRAYRLAIFA